MQITMENSSVDVQPLPGLPGGKAIIVQDKAGNVIVIPMPSEACKEIGMKLSTSLVIASGPIKSNGNGVAHG